MHVLAWLIYTSNIITRPRKTGKGLGLTVIDNGQVTQKLNSWDANLVAAGKRDGRLIKTPVLSRSAGTNNIITLECSSER